MIELTCGEASQAMEAAPQNGAQSVDWARLPFPTVATDSRRVQTGQCFVALRGPRFDGHDFVGQALQKGASIVVVQEAVCRPTGPSDGEDLDRLVLRVTDTTVALQRLAHHVRRKWGRPLLAITGSAGKTTTRRFAAAVLGRTYRVFESQGNLNNHIGVPLSLLQLEERHELAVVELGMNHAGELRELGRISSPTGAVIANVASVHLEFFADLDDIARAKGEVLESLPGDGLLVYNADDPRVTRLAAQYAGRKASFGLEKEADVRIDGCEFHSLDEMRFELSAVGERLPIRVPFAGRHFLYNLAAAAASGLSFGLNLAEVRRGMEALEPAAMRGQVLRIEHGRRSGVAIWDDSYNANPFAMEAVLDTVARLRGFSRKVLALGEMLELGSTAAVLHRETGRRAAASGADLLITVGAHGVSIGEGAREAGMRADQVGQFATSELAAEFLREEVRPGDLVLVKGSRGVRMDRIVQSLRECD